MTEEMLEQSEDFVEESEGQEALDFQESEPTHEGAEAEAEAREPTVEELLAEKAALERANAGLIQDLRSTRQKNAQRFETLESRLEQLNAALTQQPSPDDELEPEPDRTEDPVGWLDWRRRADQAQERRARAEREMAAMEQNAVVEMQAQVVRQAKSSESQFLSTEGAPSPEEYAKGLQATRRALYDHYRAGGNDDQQAQALVARDEFYFIRNMQMAGENPAQAAWQYYMTNVAPRNGGAQAQKPGSVEPIQRGSQAGGLGGSPGGGRRGKISMERIAAMSDEEFSEFAKGVSEAQWEQLDTRGFIER